MSETNDAQASYEQWHAQLEVDEGADAPWHRLVAKHLPPGALRGQRVLEIGCGRGGFACWLARQGPKSVVAADFSSIAIEKGRAFAKTRGLHQIRWEQQDIQAITAPDDAFDVIFSCETIEHVPDPARAVRELARVLRPGGRLFLTTPNYLGATGLYRAYLRLRGRRYQEEGQPINQLTLLPRTLYWLRSAKLAIEQVDGAGHYLPFPGRPPIPLPWFDRPHRLTKWLALHSLLVARKPAR